MEFITSVTKNLTVLRRPVIEMERKGVIGISLIVLIVALSIGILLLYLSIHNVNTGESSNSSDDSGVIAGSLSYQVVMKSSMPANPGMILIYKSNPPII